MAVSLIGGDEKMDEEIMDMTTEEQLEPVNVSIVKVDVDMDDEEPSIATTETVETVAVEPVEEIEIEVDEAIGWAGGDNERHYRLLGRDDPNQHTIGAITGLREELDEIERIKTVYSDKFNVANYYEWEGAAYSDYGYFVSLAPNTSKIKICDGLDILGVSVYDAGFVGGQNQEAPRDNSYGLIVTSGLVDVRCELDVQVGDYVVSNAYGYAKKSASNYGYRVLAKENKDGTEYVVILLGVQADKTNAIGENLGALEQRVEVNEKNIVSAINVANQAFNKAESAENAASVSKDAVESALKDILGFGDKFDEIEKAVVASNVISAQAKSIADSAANWASSMREEAVDVANDSWKKTNDLIDTLDPILTWKDDETGISGADYLATQMENGIATTHDIKLVDSKTETAMNVIKRNGKELQSLMTVVDKYSVGEYSQANGLTVEQAKSVLEPGMIYVPTKHALTDYHKEEYTYTVGGQTKTYTRWFTPGYLYRWGTIPSSEFGVGWVTVGNKSGANEPGDANREENYSSSIVSPDVGPWVFFSNREPKIRDVWEYGYWFTNGDTIVDADGNPSEYEKYTLYKWERPEGEDAYWFAVATLAGNSNNRATSMIRQTANEIEAKLSNAYGGVAGWEAEMAESYSTVGSLASWKNGEGDVGEAIIKQEAKDDGTSSIVISTLQKDSDGEIEASASLVLSAQKKEDNSGSFLAIDADNINFTASANYSVLAENITLRGDQINFTAGYFGGRNLLLDSGVEVTNAGYPTKSYYLSEVPVAGETYTITLSGELGSGKTHFAAYNSGGNVWMTSLSRVGNSSIYTSTFKWINKSGNNTGADTHVNIYPMPNSTAISTINWIKLEKGSVSTAWSPAPEDQVDAEQTSTGMSWKLLPDKCVWWNSNTSEDSPLMRLNNDGLYIKGNGEFTGTISAGDGNIGEWAIDTDYIKSVKDDYGFYLSSASNASNYWIRAQKESDSSLIFGVSKQGELIANVGEIGGNIINSTGLHITSGEISLGDNFSVSPAGKVVAKNIEVTGGKIANFNIGKFDSGKNIQAIYSGKFGDTGVYFGDSRAGTIGTTTLGESNGWRLAIGSKFGVSSSGKLYASDAKISGDITANSVSIIYKHSSSTNSLFSTSTGRLYSRYSYSNLEKDVYIDLGGVGFITRNTTTNSNTSGGEIYASGTMFYVEASVGTGHLKGTWSSDNDLSDERIKNTIETIPESYDVLFDALKPKRYKYNNGTSNRFHTGYVAQDVVCAIEQSGLTTQDFAGVMLLNENTEQECWSLRRDEFVSLNTWQIQKLKARVTELENKISQLVN